MKVEQIRPIGHNLLVFFEDSQMNDKIKLAGGLELFLDTKWVPTENVKDSGIIYAAGKKSIIPQGATAWMDYLVHSQANNPPLHVDEKGVYFTAETSDIYLWEHDGVKETIGKWVVVELIEEKKEESKSEIILLKQPKKETLGRIVFSNPEVEKTLGVKVGDTVLLDDRYNYKFDYKGDELYRVDSNIGLMAKQL